MTTFAAGEVWSAEAIEGLVRHNGCLVEENSKLHELVRRLLECIKQGKEEFGYEHGWSCAGCQYYYECDGWDQLWESAAGLGIGNVSAI